MAIAMGWARHRDQGWEQGERSNAPAYLLPRVRLQTQELSELKQRHRVGTACEGLTKMIDNLSQSRPTYYQNVDIADRVD